MDWQPGDIVACYGTDALSRLIRIATTGPAWSHRLWCGPSHVGLITDHPVAGPVWVESTTLARRPCLIRQQLVTGLQAHLPADRVNDYLAHGGRVEVWRLTPIARLSRDEAHQLTTILVRHFLLPGVGYDTGGALLSASRAVSRTWLLPPARRDSVFCSGLIAALLMRLHRLPWTNPAQFHPAGLLRRLHWSGVIAFHCEYLP
jgi:hypothetical protein